MRFLLAVVLSAVIVLGSVAAFAEQAWPEIPRKLPPEGIKLSADEEQRVRLAVDGLAKRLTEAGNQARSARRAELLPDVVVYLNAAKFALENGEFFDAKEVGRALDLIQQGHRRLDELQAGKNSWAEQSGLVVRGYRSEIDGSVQPYGLVIPDKLDRTRPCPLMVWLHGRGDKATELNFIHGRQTSAGSMAPEDMIVLHPFGRYCNAFKFAGEIDIFEAIDHASKHYPIDPDRIVLAGFSMGGAGSWHLGAHYADRWVAVSPGAGFAETARYQKLKPEQFPEPYVQRLWSLYDVPGYVRNLFNVPVIAYSGEIDPQKQAARIMEEAFAEQGGKLVHLIGPGMGHKYHPDVLADLTRRLQDLAAKGREKAPLEVTLETRTLRYPGGYGLEMLALDEQWQDSRLDAKVLDSTQLSFTTKNVAAFRVDGTWSQAPRATSLATIKINGQSIALPAPHEKGKDLNFERVDGRWQTVAKFPSSDGLRKLSGLQGPIDDVFLSRRPLLVVMPTGKSAHPQVDRWVQAEMSHQMDRWRRLFRGELPVKKDSEVTEDDVARCNLLVWGDPKSNQLLARLAERLPIRWTSGKIQAGGRSFAGEQHVLAMIYPNPLNPERYVVVNSGPTFREGHDGTNSQQTPKLPDWAVIDVSQPPSDVLPGGIAAAEFFDERWELRAERAR